MQVSHSVIASKLDVTSKTVQRLFKAMRDEDLMRTVVDVTGTKQYMVNPAFHCVDASKYERMFMQAMYHTGSHDDAVMWARVCRDDYQLYDYKSFVFDMSTGEIRLESVRPLFNDEVVQWLDDVYRTKQLLTEQAMLEHDLQQSFNEQLSEYDMFWFARINSEDYHKPQPKLSKYQRMSLAFKHIDSLKDKSYEDSKSLQQTLASFAC